MSKKFNLDLPRMGYFLAYRSTNSWANKLIVKRQLNAGFTEREASVTHIEVSGGGPDSINIAPPISKRINIVKKHKGRYVYILKYPNEKYERYGRYKVAYFSATLNNTGYDILGILSFIFKWIKQSNRLMFCSEGALWALQKQHPKAFDIKPENCMPADFMEGCECVWEGVIESEIYI